MNRVARWIGSILAGSKRRAEASPALTSAELARCVPLHARLDATRAERHLALTRRFLGEKDFLGHRGLRVTDDMRITIAGQACVLLLGLPHLGVFPRVPSVIVHRSPIDDSTSAIGPDGRSYAIEKFYAGVAWHGGPVQIAWDSVLHSLRRPAQPFNVVLHEFAHVLDGADGVMGGSPPMPSGAEQRTFEQVFARAYERLRREVSLEQTGVLNAYAAESPVEFFAVATEAFFEQPHRLAAWDGAVFEQLRRFYCQDPREYA